MKKLLIILVLPLLLVACESGEDKKSEDATPNKEVENAVKEESENEKKLAKSTDDKKNKEESDKKTEKKDSKSKEISKKRRKDLKDKKKAVEYKKPKSDKNDKAKNTKSSENKLSDAKKEDYHQKSLAYVREYIGDPYEIVIDEYADFTQNGKIEGVVFIQDMDNLTKVLLLDVESEKARLISDYTFLDFSDDWPYNDILFHSAGFVKIEGIDTPVPILAREGNKNSNSYILFSISGDYIQPFVDTTNYCDVGTTELIDSDNDGDYDGYLIERWGYDVFYYPLTLKYQFFGDMVAFESGEILLSEYPSDPIDLVKECIYLSHIRDRERNAVGEFTDIKNLDERLFQQILSPDCDFKPEYIFSLELLQDTVLGLDTAADFVDEIYEDFGCVTIYPKENADRGDREIVFEVSKKNGQWIITNIAYPEDYWKSNLE